MATKKSRVCCVCVMCVCACNVCVTVCVHAMCVWLCVCVCVCVCQTWNISTTHRHNVQHFKSIWVCFRHLACTVDTLLAGFKEAAIADYIKTCGNQAPRRPYANNCNVPSTFTMQNTCQFRQWLFRKYHSQWWGCDLITPINNQSKGALVSEEFLESRMEGLLTVDGMDISKFKLQITGVSLWGWGLHGQPLASPGAAVWCCSLERVYRSPNLPYYHASPPFHDCIWPGPVSTISICI